MKIISGYKDFYDYLSGIYGVDPKIVLDRRIFDNVELLTPCKVVFLICGKRIEGFFDGNKCYYGNSLFKFGKKITRNSFPSWMRRYLDKNSTSEVHVEIDLKNFENYYGSSRNSTINVNTEILDMTEPPDLNKKHDCPILMLTGIESVSKFPPLMKFDVGSIMPPEQIYKLLVEWYSNKNNELENRIDTRTDVEKLTSKGFDKKESFRPKIKV